jgi:serine phosphatase RsbU (regulator of sigma subunit)
VLATVADLVGTAVSRTRHTDQEHDVIVQLQRSLLPGPVELAGTEIAARYRPALSLAGLGGDFYDIVVTPEGGAYVVVGDITGHGPEAVAAMAELQSLVRHLLESGAALDAVVHQADAALRRRGTLASVVVAHLDEQRDVLTYVNAGHPYPVLRRSGGATTLLRDGHGPILGLGTAHGAEPAEVSFGPDDLVVLYTDGLIERRDTAIDDSMDELARLTAGLPGGSIDAVLDAVDPGVGDGGNGAHPDDDVAVLVARRR